uniref:putative reverse transcriptase/maturase n=1 Tax=Glaucosphaera vacuolata TaxID=38265 RepID=UPI001FCDE216|nr:putative reverse transcriptase/maturase [Glaucosphaera vacuolata]UNJ18637.1 putative reverse transcriptase/maturase [Glaucosphaera vacuolata]
MNNKSTSLPTSWDKINWQLVEKCVNGYRTRIFLAKKSGDMHTLRKTQYRVAKSKMVLLEAMRRVTFIKKENVTPGLDRLIYLRPEERWSLFQKLLKLNIDKYTPPSACRIYIVKPNRKLCPLRIPIIQDCILQFVIKTALEPEWEAIVEYGSYSFRPARSCHDALLRTYKILSHKRRCYVLKSDIKGCFGNISHEVLLKRIGDFPWGSLIAKWLKAGYMEEGILYDTDIGTPQRVIIRPLLLNIALHGMENTLGIKYHKGAYVRGECKFVLLRYADDFIVFCDSLQEAEEAKKILINYLLSIGLKLSQDKILITDVKKGFDFLGWTFRLFEDKQKKSGMITLVKPSKKAIVKFKQSLRKRWRNSLSEPISETIRKLNSLIVGWCNYHRYANSSYIFRWFTHFNYLQAVRLIKRKHPNKSWQWLCDTYFTTVNGERWVFFDRVTGIQLVRPRNYKILDYIPVKYTMCPDVPDKSVQEYFQKRKLNLTESKLAGNKRRLQMVRW